MTKERGRTPRPGAQEIRPSTNGSLAKRSWLKRAERVIQPRRAAMRQAENELWDGLDELARRYEQAQAAVEQATATSATTLHDAAAGWPEPGTSVPEPVPGTWTGTPAWRDFATESGAMPDHQDPSSERPTQAQAGTGGRPAQVASGQPWAEYLAAQAAADAARALSSDLGTDAGLEAYLLSNEADAAYDQYAGAWVRENCSQTELDAIEAQNRAEGWELGQ
jgi:hypothetical protein